MLLTLIVNGNAIGENHVRPSSITMGTSGSGRAVEVSFPKVEFDKEFPQFSDIVLFMVVLKGSLMLLT
jgi:hypothetical protein